MTTRTAPRPLRAPAPAAPRAPRIRPRAGLAIAALGAVLVGLALVALATGDYPLTPGQAAAALVDGDAPGALIVQEWRAPRVLAAAAFGAALGVSGAVFQSLTRNALGSPDVIGFATGSYTGVLVAGTVLGAGYAATATGALVGGLGAAVVVYLLAYRRGASGLRLIVVGIGVTAFLHSVNTWLLLRAQTEIAMEASIWASGSLSLLGWDEVAPAVVLLAALVPVIAALSGPLRQLELGDDAARAHGVRVEPARAGLLVAGVALVAVVTASAGPIAFVALAAPQIAHRLVRGAGLPLVASALVGAVVLLTADLVGQHLLPVGVPVGMVTVVVGGAYLLVLLVRESRRRG